MPYPREPWNDAPIVSAAQVIDPDVLARLAADPEPPQLHVRPIPGGRAWILDLCCARLYLSDQLPAMELSGAVTQALDALAVWDVEHDFNPLRDLLVEAFTA